MNDFVRFLDPSWGQVGGKLALKIDGKSIQKALGVSTSFWGRSRSSRARNNEFAMVMGGWEVPRPAADVRSSRGRKVHWVRRYKCVSR